MTTTFLIVFFITVGVMVVFVPLYCLANLFDWKRWLRITFAELSGASMTAIVIEIILGSNFPIASMIIGFGLGFAVVTTIVITEHAKYDIIA